MILRADGTMGALEACVLWGVYAAAKQAGDALNWKQRLNAQLVGMFAVATPHDRARYCETWECLQCKTG